MWKRILKHVVAIAAASATTLTVFSAVISLADDKKATGLAERIRPALVAGEVFDRTSR